MAMFFSMLEAGKVVRHGLARKDHRTEHVYTGASCGLSCLKTPSNETHIDRRLRSKNAVLYKIEEHASSRDTGIFGTLSVWAGRARISAEALPMTVPAESSGGRRGRRQSDL
jgi:hypothetical protein